MLRESIDKNIITKISVFDFDQTLVNTPLPDQGRIDYEKKTGNKWPYEGWWGRALSLDTSIFEMSVVPETLSAYNKEKTNPETLIVMLTGRMSKLASEVKLILDEKGLKFDVYEYNRGGNTLDSKIKSLERLLSEHPNVTELELWDDRIPHVEEFQKWGDSKENLTFKINIINGSYH